MTCDIWTKTCCETHVRCMNIVAEALAIVNTSTYAYETESHCFGCTITGFYDLPIIGPNHFCIDQPPDARAEALFPSMTQNTEASEVCLFIMELLQRDQEFLASLQQSDLNIMFEEDFLNCLMTKTEQPGLQRVNFIDFEELAISHQIKACVPHLDPNYQLVEGQYIFKGHLEAGFETTPLDAPLESGLSYYEEVEKEYLTIKNYYNL